jgi:hypothetical protein
MLPAMNNTMNAMIRDRIRFFQAELSRKGSDTGSTVSETCFICQRAVLLIQDYCQPGIEPLKKQALMKLQEAMDQADQYFDAKNRKGRPVNISYTQVVQPAREALTAFLAKAR